MGLKISEFVDNIKEKENSDIICIEHRMNNPKRDFLFVNKIQGKHIPTRPNDFYGMVGKLFKLTLPYIKDSRHIGIIGFCETATGISYAYMKYLTSYLYLGESEPSRFDLDLMSYSTMTKFSAGYIKSNKTIEYMQTTRYEVNEAYPNISGGNTEKLIKFEEQHSHATTQVMYGNLERLQKIDTLIIIDDEISTGNTVLNMVNELKRIRVYPKNIICLSVCNWQTEEQRKKFSEQNIVPLSLINGNIKDINGKMNCTVVDINDSEIYNSNTEALKAINARVYESGFASIGTILRSGFEVSNRVLEIIRAECIELAARIKQNNSDSTFNLIGIEEYMGVVAQCANAIEYLYESSIAYFRATTRSPIDIMAENSDKSDFEAIKSRTKLHSANKDSVISYLYNIDSVSSELHILTGTHKISEGFKSDIKALSDKFGKSCHVYVTADEPDWSSNNFCT